MNDTGFVLTKQQDEIHSNLDGRFTITTLMMKHLCIWKEGKDGKRGTRMLTLSLFQGPKKGDDETHRLTPTRFCFAHLLLPTVDEGLVVVVGSV